MHFIILSLTNSTLCTPLSPICWVLGGSGSQLTANCVFLLAVLSWSVILTVLCVGCSRILSPGSFQIEDAVDEVHEMKLELEKKERRRRRADQRLEPRKSGVFLDTSVSDDFLNRYGYSWDYALVLPVPAVEQRKNSINRAKSKSLFSLYNIDTPNEKQKESRSGRVSGKEKEKGKKGKEGQAYRVLSSKADQDKDNDECAVTMMENPMKSARKGSSLEPQRLSAIDVSDAP